MRFWFRFLVVLLMVSIFFVLSILFFIWLVVLVVFSFIFFVFRFLLWVVLVFLILVSWCFFLVFIRLLILVFCFSFIGLYLFFILILVLFLFVVKCGVVRGGLVWWGIREGCEVEGGCRYIIWIFFVVYILFLNRRIYYDILIVFCCFCYYVMWN